MKKIFYSSLILVIIAAFCFLLVACNASSYESKFKKAGYETMVLEEDEISNAIGDTEVEWIVYGFKSNKDFAYAVKFIDKADAGKFETFLKTEAEEEIDYVRLGKIIVFGTKVAVNAVT